MSKHTIDAAEDALKKALSQKDGLEKVVDKIHDAEPVVASGYGYDHKATLLMKQAISDARQAYQLVEGITRSLAGAIHLMDTSDREQDEAQGDLFDGTGDGAAEEPEISNNGRALPAAASGTPTLARERTLPGGDAHDSFSGHTMLAETPRFQGTFDYDGRRYVAMSMSPGHWIDAYEVLSPDEFEAANLEKRGIHTGERILLQDDEVVLGGLVRFVAAVDVDFEVEYEVAAEGV